MQSINLTSDEIKDITGKQRFNAQLKELNRLGIPAKPRADGSPLVVRVAYLIAMGVSEDHTKEYTPEPNYDAIVSA